MDCSICALKGTKLILRSMGPPESDRFYSEHIGDQFHNLNRFLRILLGEAIYAAEAFADDYGYLPAQPRLSVTLEDSNRPAAPRRWEKIAEMEALEKALETAAGNQEAGDKPS